VNDIMPIEESPEAVLREIRTASEAFGAVREGTHIIAYEQKRVVHYVTWLLADGRWALAGLASAAALVDTVRLESYRLSPAEREAIERAVKEADASVSNRRIAKMLGVSHTQVNEDLGKNLPPPAEHDNETKGGENAGGNNLPLAPSGPVRGTQGTGDNEWFTPVEHIERARRVLGEIDVDPASHIQAQKRVKATQYFTQSDDGLKREWRGKVWLNPPLQPTGHRTVRRQTVARAVHRPRYRSDSPHRQLDRHCVGSEGRAGRVADLLHTRPHSIRVADKRRGRAGSGTGILLLRRL
jgi:hypothetical protein